MGTAPSGFQTPKTNWASADVPTPSDFNRIEGNVNAIEQGSRTLDPAQAPTGNVGALRQLLDWFANRIKAITGKANWYDTPDTTLAAAKSHFEAPAPHTGHALSSHTHSGGDITSAVANANYATSAGSTSSASNADKVDGCDAGTGANNVLKLDSSGLVPLNNIPSTLTGKSADMLDGYHASSFAIAPIPVTSLKKATGSWSGTVSAIINVHQFTFASPAARQGPLIGGPDYISEIGYIDSSSTDVRKWSVTKKSLSSVTLYITWDYLTASGHPRVWAIVDDAGNIVSMWEAEDPVDEEDPDICPIGTTNEKGESIIPTGGAVLPVQFPTQLQIAQLKAHTKNLTMPEFALRGVWAKKGHKTPDSLIMDIFNTELAKRGLEPLPDVQEAWSIQDEDKRNWRIQLWLRGVSRVKKNHRASTLIPLFQEMFRVDKRTGKLEFK